MRKFLAIFVMAFSVPALAQHSSSLTWTAPADAIATTTYNVYRANAPCASPLPTMTKLVNVATTSYLDTTITVGNWCYVVTQVTNSVESAYSPASGGVAAPNTITVVTVVVK